MGHRGKIHTAESASKAHPVVDNNRRRADRYTITNPLKIGLTLQKATIDADLLNVSTSGMRLNVPQKPGVPVVLSNDVAINARIGGQVIAGPAEVVWVTRYVERIEMGLRFSGNRIGVNLLQPAIQSLLKSNHACSLSLSEKDKQLHVHGALNFHCAKDMIRSVNSLRPSSIGLQRCTHLDSAGIGLIGMCVEKGIKINTCAAEIRNLVQLAFDCKNICGKPCQG